MIDIHSHILWGLDDGAQNPTVSMDLARIAADHGYFFHRLTVLECCTY